jgi:hypothetical protein
MWACGHVCMWACGHVDMRTCGHAPCGHAGKWVRGEKGRWGSGQVERKKSGSYETVRLLKENHPDYLKIKLIKVTDLKRLRKRHTAFIFCDWI